MDRFLTLVLLSFFFFCFTGSATTRQILSTETQAVKNQTKISSPLKNQTKIPNIASKNQTKLATSSGKNQTIPTVKKEKKLLSDTSKNQTKILNNDIKNQTKLATSSAKNQTTPAVKKEKKPLADQGKNQTKIPTTDIKNQTKLATSSAKNQTKLATSITKNQTTPAVKKEKKLLADKPKKIRGPVWAVEDLEEVEEEGSDLISEFRDLPYKFHDTLLPDLEKIFSKARKELSGSIKPFVGRRYAGPALSAIFFLLPLLLFLVLLRHARRHLSLQRIVLFGQAYAAIYFAVLFLASVVTGLEPLRLLYAAAPRAYVAVQLAQAAAYVALIVLQMASLLLPQLAVTAAVGLHYYVAVLHRAVAGEAPKTSWRAHFIYAVCFLAVFGVSRANDRRKKAYLDAGEDDGKNS
ncbi:cell wall integrity/stress response component-like protein [Wolffia australiana]